MDEHAPDQTDLEKKERRRPWLIMGGITAFLLAVLGCVFTFYDGPAPDDSDMMPTWSQRGGNTNPLAMLCKNIGAPTPASRPYDAKVRQDIRVEALRKTLARGSSNLDQLEALLRTDPATWQWPDPDLMISQRESGYLKIIRQEGYLYEEKAELLRLEGKMGEAAEACLQRIRLGNGMCGAEGGISHLGIAESMIIDGLESLQKVLTTEGISRDLLAHCQAQLNLLTGPAREDMAHALKVRYQQFKSKVLQKDINGAEGNPYPSTTGDKMLATFFFKPHRTLAMQLPPEQTMQRHLTQSWESAFQNISQIRDKMEATRDNEVPYLRLLNANAAGEAVSFGQTYSSVTSMSWAMRTRSALRQAEIMLALRRHELEKGGLPPRLEELVPAYLTTIPTDDFAGEPMKWNALTSIVYSVGFDSKDDGGHYAPNTPVRKWRDISQPYWWSELAKTIAPDRR
jgi:hypothetical protein